MKAPRAAVATSTNSVSMVYRIPQRGVAPSGKVCIEMVLTARQYLIKMLSTGPCALSSKK